MLSVSFLRHSPSLFPEGNLVLGYVYEYCSSTHLPRKAIALAVVVPKVGNFAVLDVHPRLSHRALGITVASLGVVDNDLRDGADVRPTVGLVYVGGVVIRIPPEHLVGR